MPAVGSRLGSRSTDDRAFAVWSGTRAGVEVSRKQDLRRGVATCSDPPALSRGVRDGLRYGGLALALAGLAAAASELRRRRHAARRNVSA